MHKFLERPVLIDLYNFPHIHVLMSLYMYDILHVTSQHECSDQLKQFLSLDMDIITGNSYILSY